MKRTNLIPIYLLLLLTLSLTVYNLYVSSKTKIASIDTAKVLKAYKSVAELSASLQEQSNTFKLRLDTLANEFQISVKDYEKKRSTLSEEDRRKEELKLRQKQEQYAQFESSTQEGLKKQEVKIIEQALTKINGKIIAYATSKGYSAVMGISPGSGIIYANDYIDITDEILQIIND